ncbi:MAG: sigma-70 family RNA polymerase sigma factor [Bacteroidota bacterium]
MLPHKHKHIKELSDEVLIDHYRKEENPIYVGELFERYTHIVFLVCMKYLKNETESEDVAMQVFEKLISDLRKYEIKTFKYWLHTVTKNQCLVFLEKKKRLRHKEDIFLETEQALVESSEDFSLLGEGNEKEQQLALMRKAIGVLKQEQKICVELFYLQQKSYQEVSEETGYTMKQVKSYIQNGKRNLKIQMEKMAAPQPLPQTSSAKSSAKSSKEAASD